MAQPIDPKRIAERGLRSDGMSWLTAKDGFEEAAGKIRRIAQGSDGVELVDVEHSLVLSEMCVDGSMPTDGV